MNATIQKLTAYPIKSFDGVDVEQVAIIPSGGIQHDRQFAFTDTNDNYFNGKNYSQIHRFETHLINNWHNIVLIDKHDNQREYFDLKTDLDTCTLRRAINAKCPEDINIVSCNVVSPDFHARYSAVRRTYRYQCYTGTNPLYKNQSWFLSMLNIDTLNSISKNLLGTHDFLSFSKWNNQIKNTKWVNFHLRLTQELKC